MKKISLRLDDETHSCLSKSARSVGLSINAFLQQIVEQNSTRQESEIEALSQSLVLMQNRLEEVAQEARYARVHTEEVIQSLVLRPKPAEKEGWEKTLQAALKRGEGE